METQITLTTGQIIGWILAMCTGITCISGAITVCINGLKRVRAPEMIQNKRLDILESKIKEHDELLNSGNYRLDLLEEGNRITQKAILALLSHGIDGNDIESMKTAKQDLQDFLIKR